MSRTRVRRAAAMQELQHQKVDVGLTDSCAIQKKHPPTTLLQHRSSMATAMEDHQSRPANGCISQVPRRIPSRQSILNRLGKTPSHHGEIPSQRGRTPSRLQSIIMSLRQAKNMLATQRRPHPIAQWLLLPAAPDRQVLSSHRAVL